MCIACRVRELQQKLIRLQQDDNTIIPYRGQGRSFYLCSDCSRSDKKVRGLIKRFRLSKDDSLKLIEYLKELE
jgi:predicted RNA-binding protein YlxR (DUF448 family)